jgi:hypothetical protein
LAAIAPCGAPLPVSEAVDHWSACISSKRLSRSSAAGRWRWPRLQRQQARSKRSCKHTGLGLRERICSAIASVSSVP